MKIRLPPSVLNRAECLGTIAAVFQGKALPPPAIRRALESATFENGVVRPVFELIQPGESVCLVVSDHTRRTAADLVLPVLLEGLLARGCRAQDFFILFASGIHRPPAPAEVEKIIGRGLTRAFSGRIFFHDPDDAKALVGVGRLGAGPEVKINRRAVEADRLILTGAANFHYHAGFGGGRKSLVPGLADRQTIAYTHSLTIDPVEDRLRPGVAIGNLAGNPVAEAMLAGARLCAPDFIVNTALTPDGKLAGVFAGDLVIAHQQACQLARQISRVDISRPADFVIASAGAAANWIQSHKAFYNAHRAIHKNGRVILLAPCPEGLGDERFRYWARQSSLAEIYRGLRQAPEVLGQTALSTRARAGRTVLVTDMRADDLADLGLRAANNLESALQMVLAELAAAGLPRPSYYLMPDALYVVPFPRA